jgi:hypothetical protein
MAWRRPTLTFTSGLLACIALIAGFAYLSFGLGSSDGDREDVAQNDSEANCAENWTMCRDNADLVNYSRKAHEARRACISAVDEAGKYGPPKWCSGWLCEDFASYRIGSNAPDDGLLTLIDNHLQTQNAPGAWSRATAYCTYNIRTAKVVALSISTN